MLCQVNNSQNKYIPMLEVAYGRRIASTDNFL